ncbi:MAG: type II secretion system minor pseudopilin GspK [Betaproteobacteria bacterium]
MSARTQRGAALVVAMLVAAIAAAVATTLTVEGVRWQSIVEGRRDHARAASLAAAGVQWARQVLADDAARGPVDDLGEPWAFALPPTPVEGGTVEGRIDDAQARLNINALGGSDAAAAIAHQRLERLFARSGADGALVDAISDWVDADGTTRERGAEDAAYARDGGVAANAPLARIGELASVRGMSAPTLARISADVAALPADAAVNVNTATANVLAAVLPSLDAEAIAAIVATRRERPYRSLDDFSARTRSGTAVVDTTGLAVGSRHFLVTVRAKQGDVVAKAEALLARGNGRLPVIVWQVVD